ncbi:hypothetical protein SAY87_015631 [Trapa incisa]|uniref:Uncharacterized protein n=2 Tax=Trapa TaxID=22665 RepID=A0AAN7LSY3_TRANT|nr:hypothetical protein SAY87_015631 [Trapa incisa]KAK4785197.1 hypothetical protein SAY86_001886 [Trapa natans]
MAAMSVYSPNVHLPLPLPKLSAGIRRLYRFEINITCSSAEPNCSGLQLRLPIFTNSQCRKVVLTAACAMSDSAATEEGILIGETRVLDNSAELRKDGGGCGDDNGNVGGGGGGDRGGDGGGDGEEDEYGPVMKYADIIREAEARGAKLPADMLDAAKTTGLPKVILERYLELQGSFWPLGFLMKHFAMLRNRMLADPSFLFKIGTEIVIDSCCATFAEVQKRGKDFWSEFELYVADLLVGLVVNIALVGMLAPYVRIGRQSVSGAGFLGRIQHAYNSLPSSVFEANKPGCNFTIKQRTATYFFKGILYGSVGFGCGLIGQGIANLIMTAKRSIHKTEEDIPVPPLVQSAALWGVFLAVSSNTRYQIVNGLERLVETSPLAKNVPPVALAFTVGVRFANNVYGGMQFVDWARWSGVQ